MADPQIYQCPQCNNALEATPAEEAAVIACPQCGGELEIPAFDHLPPPSVSRDDELSALRIKHVTQTRRELYRTRSYFIIGAVASSVVAMQLAYTAIGIVRSHGPVGRAIAYSILAFVALAAAGAFWRHALIVHREARKPVLTDPPTPPDFSTLSDGSDQWKNLEDVQ